MNKLIIFHPDGTVQIRREIFPQGSSCANCIHRCSSKVAYAVGQISSITIGTYYYIPEPQQSDYSLMRQLAGCNNGNKSQHGICTAFEKDPGVRLMFNKIVPNSISKN